MIKTIRFILHPVPQPEKGDTGLRFTDILFGFVLSELFIRLGNQDWAHPFEIVQLQLLVGTNLVLGSWLGFRLSLYRSSYQIKFFNLPLFRFLIDQLMLVLYFKIAILTPRPASKNTLPPLPQLAETTVKLVVYIFVLYALWDLLGLRMAKAKIKMANGTRIPRYPALIEGKKTNQEQAVNWIGICITITTLIFLSAIWFFARSLGPIRSLVCTFVVLLAYRLCKEIRTSYQLLQQQG